MFFNQFNSEEINFCLPNPNYDKFALFYEENYFNPFCKTKNFFETESQEYNVIPLEEKKTSFATKENQLKINQTAKIEEKNDFLGYTDIKTFLENNNDFSRIAKNFIKDEKIEEGENNFKQLKKKRKRGKKIWNKMENEANTEIYGRGRKAKNDSTVRSHNKLSPDNIMKKIKTKLFERVILFINSLLINYLNLGEEKKVAIKNLDYKKYIDPMKKEQDLKFLNMTLKDIYSLDISPKYSNFQIDSNKKYIESLEEKKDEIILFVLNLKFKEWIDIFTLKKNVKDFGASDMNANIIEQNMPKIIDLFDEIIKDEGNMKYLSNFIFYLYNYESWFLNKRGRKK